MIFGTIINSVETSPEDGYAQQGIQKSFVEVFKAMGTNNSLCGSDDFALFLCVSA